MNYTQRRNKLMASLPEECSAFFFAGKMNPGSDRYKVNRNFYYLTGIDEVPGLILMMTKHRGALTTILFNHPFDPVKARWMGGQASNEQLSSISGIEKIGDITTFEMTVAAKAENERHLGTVTWFVDAEGEEGASKDFAHQIAKKYPTIVLKDVYRAITSLRLIKDEEEVAALRKANVITSEGVKAMLRACGPDKMEMELEGVFWTEGMKYGHRELSFPCIVAGGMNATTLHYGDNNTPIHQGDLVLVDLGFTHNHYCADVSRTFPVSGKFSPRQRELYECVLGAQRLVEQNAKPGLTTEDLNDLVLAYYSQVLPLLGLKKPVQEYYFHHVSHEIGLDCHDCTLERGSYVLEKGVVISNEPGLYIRDEGIGIRIEDDLLITETGCVNLTVTPKIPEEIEAIMKK